MTGESGGQWMQDKQFRSCRGAQAGDACMLVGAAETGRSRRLWDGKAGRIEGCEERNEEWGTASPISCLNFWAGFYLPRGGEGLGWGAGGSALRVWLWTHEVPVSHWSWLICESGVEASCLILSLQNTANVCEGQLAIFRGWEEARACLGGEKGVLRHGTWYWIEMPPRAYAWEWHDMICIIKRSLWW